MSQFLNGTDPGLRQTRTPTTDNFAAGVDFTAGSTTQLTLSADPGTEDNVEITFDGIQQHRNTYSVSGTTVTFDAAIGSGVTNVEATFTTTVETTTPVDNSVTKDKLASGLINAHTDTVITASDEILFGDATDSNNLKKDTVQGILDLAGGGTYEFVSSADAASQSSVEFTGLEDDAFYKLVTRRLIPGTSNTQATITFGTGGTPTYASSGYRSAQAGYGAGASRDTENGPHANTYLYGFSGAQSSSYTVSAETLLYTGSSSLGANYIPTVTTSGGGLAHGGSTPVAFICAGLNDGGTFATTAMTAIKITCSSGTFTNGVITLYKQITA